MKFSKDTETFIKILNDNFTEQVNFIEIIGTMVEITASYNDGHLLFNEFLMNGAILYKLSNKLKNSSQSQEGINLVQKEFEKSLVDLKSNINDLISYMDKDDKYRFDSTFLSMTKDSVINLINFSSDLYLIKQMQRK